MVLVFEPFIPKAKTVPDFSDLEKAIKSTNSYQRECSESIFCFLRGSSVSSFGGQLVKAHKDSDIDVVSISSKSKRYINQAEEIIHEIPISVDYNNINIQDLEYELENFPNHLILTNDLVMDSMCIEGNELYTHYRQMALLNFLSLGLDDNNFVTASGAMKAVCDARIMVNPLRWWSIQYSFKESNQFKSNILRYYQDISKMLTDNFEKKGILNQEPYYEIPSEFLSKPNLLKTKFNYYLSKVVCRANSTPVISLSDFSKVKNKYKSIITYAIKNKVNMDAIFAK